MAPEVSPRGRVRIPRNARVGAGGKDERRIDVVAARLTDLKRQKIVADYINTQSVNAAAKMNGVSWDTANRVITETRDIEKKLEEKNRRNTADVLAYMESEKERVCRIIGNGLSALEDPEKFAEATPSQITTALGTLIDKWAMIKGEDADGANVVEVIIDV